MVKYTLSSAEKHEKYQQIISRIETLVEGVSDEIAVLATVVCELHQNLPGFHWTGFYRVTAPDVLTVGPYQGTHGCLYIPFHRGVCGESARTRSSILVEDVNTKSDHIACSSATISELVVPVLDKRGEVRAVLDLDSNFPSHFDEVDQHYCEHICQFIARIYSE